MELFKRDDKGCPGAVWWQGSYQCRNFHGYYQCRENGRGQWQFVIYAFGGDDASIYKLNSEGNLHLSSVPYDANDRIIVDGRKFGRRFWTH